MPDLTASDIKRYHVYEAKRPRRVGMLPERVNDRMVVYVGKLSVQYDSPTVAIGRRLPTVSMERFLRWAGQDVTDLMPDGDWRTWPPGSEDVQQTIK